MNAVAIMKGFRNTHPFIYYNSTPNSYIMKTALVLAELGLKLGV